MNRPRETHLFASSCACAIRHTVAMTKHNTLAALVVVLAVFLSACGGGGGDSGTPAPPVAVVPTLTGSTAISGVAANGAPLLGASIRVIDANGRPVSLLDAAGTRVTSLPTSTADGSFRIVLAANSTPLPLLLQASGVDGAGTPLVLHSALTSTTLPLTVNFTPVTDALVAMVLGTAPRTVFASPALSASTLPLLADATAVTSASDLIKAILATGMADAKVTNAKTLNLLADNTFLANRLLLDAVLDGTRIQLTQDNTGRELVQFSNRFTTPGTVEVSVDLATARAELVLGATGSVAKAITSTLKVATSPLKATLVNLGTLDALTGTINTQIAQGASSATMTTLLLGAYTQHDGRNRAAMANLLATYATGNLQLGRWQLTGCVTDPIPTAGCTKFHASALVINSVGQAVDVLNDTVGTDTSKPPKWLLLGNGRSATARIAHVAQATFNLDGTPANSAAPPSNGLQLSVRAQDSTATQTIASATVQVPSGFGVRLAYCASRLLCVAPSSGAVTATGELSDTLLQKTPGLVGLQDAAFGAKYVATVIPVTGTAEVFNSYLQAKQATDLGLGLFPKPDATLSLATFNENTLLSWKNWSEARPDMRVSSVRLILNSPPVIRDITLPGPMAASVFLPAPTVTVTSFQLWIGAQDSAGRFFYSQFKSGP